MKASNKKYCAKYRDEMITALFFQYVRNLPKSTLIEFDRIYTEETGDTLDTNFSCGHCILYLVGKVGKVYFTDYPDELTTEQKENFIPLKNRMISDGSNKG